VSDVAAFLTGDRETILKGAEAALARVHARHYETAGAEEVRRRLGSLLDQLVDGIAMRDLTPIIEYSEHVAAERFAAGYDLTEVQTAFNALEEAAWVRVLDRLERTDYAEALGLISTCSARARMRWRAATSHLLQIRRHHRSIFGLCFQGPNRVERAQRVRFFRDAGRTPSRHARVMGVAEHLSTEDFRGSELASRDDGAIDVRLFWQPGCDEVSLRYLDRGARDHFTTTVPKTRALDAFDHPNAYRPRQKRDGGS
jgi:hypothetical protein